MATYLLKDRLSSAATGAVRENPFAERDGQVRLGERAGSAADDDVLRVGDGRGVGMAIVTQ
ncbi:hypothetical protein ACWCOV_29865 [Kribbella sp. NPDC002412]